LDFKNIKMAEIQKRQIAYKVKIGDIHKGEYVQEAGWTPNYVLIDEKKVSRVNIIGVIVNIEQGIEAQSFDVEDDSGRISVRFFEEKEQLKELNVGEIVLIIGRPREYNNEKYIVPEIIKEVDGNWLELRTFELEKDVGEENEEKRDDENKERGVDVEEVEIEEVNEGKDGGSEEVIKIIKEEDKGDGVDYERVLEKVKNEKFIKILLEEGEIFEIKPGKLKVL